MESDRSLRTAHIVLVVCTQACFFAALYWGPSFPGVWLAPGLGYMAFGFALIRFRERYARMWGKQRGANFTPRASVVSGGLSLMVGALMAGVTTVSWLLQVSGQRRCTGEKFGLSSARWFDRLVMPR